MLRVLAGFFFQHFKYKGQTNLPTSDGKSFTARSPGLSDKIFFNATIEQNKSKQPRQTPENGMMDLRNNGILLNFITCV